MLSFGLQRKALRSISEYIYIYINKFPANPGDMSKVHGQPFLQDVKLMEERESKAVCVGLCYLMVHQKYNPSLKLFIIEFNQKL